MIEFPRRGDVCFALLGEGMGSEQSGTRPVVIVQNDVGNKHSPVTIVACITCNISKGTQPTQVIVDGRNYNKLRPSVILCEQLFTVSKEKLTKCIDRLTSEDLSRVDAAIAVSLGLFNALKAL